MPHLTELKTHCTIECTLTLFLGENCGENQRQKSNGKQRTHVLAPQGYDLKNVHDQRSLIKLYSRQRIEGPIKCAGKVGKRVPPKFSFNIYYFIYCPNSVD